MRTLPRPVLAALLGLVLVVAAGAGLAAGPQAGDEPQPPPAGAATEAEGELAAGQTGRGPRSPVDPAAALAGLAGGRESAGEVPDGRAELAGPPLRIPAELEDDATRAVYLESVRAYYEYRVDGFRHRRGVFAWQLASSKVIFVVVVLLVLSGVYFSGVQFHTTLRAMKLAAEARAGGDAAAGPGPDALGGEIEAGLDRFKVRSPVLGVIILALSFLFFYLYIVHVHPIQEIL